MFCSLGWIKFKQMFRKCVVAPSSMSTGSGLAGLVSGLGSISPGFNFLGSSPTSSSLSLCAALSLKTHAEMNTH